MSRCIARNSTARSRPQVGQWWEANTTSSSSPNSEIVSVRWWAQLWASRTTAPRIVRMLCNVWEVFSAMHSARLPGKKKFISAGASVSGVFWNTISTPSTVSVWPVWVMSTVGGISEIVPDELVWPSPLPIWPAGPRSSAAPYMYPARRGIAGVDLVLADDALHPAEVVDVGVGVDHRPHRPVAAMLAVQRERGGCGLRADQRIDHDHAGVALDDGHDRQVEATELVDARAHLEQPVLDEQLPLPPQARVRRLGCFGVAHELVGIEVPHHASVSGSDLPLGRSADEAMAGVVEVLPIVHRQRRREGVDGCSRRRCRCRFAHVGLPWFPASRSGEQLRLLLFELGVGDHALFLQRRQLRQLVGGARRTGRGADVGLERLLPCRCLLDVALRHLAAAGDQVDEDTEPWQNDDEECPEGLADAAEIAAAEDVDDHPEQQQDPGQPEEPEHEGPEHSEDGIVVGEHGDVSLSCRWVGGWTASTAGALGDVLYRNGCTTNC